MIDEELEDTRTLEEALADLLVLEKQIAKKLNLHPKWNIRAELFARDLRNNLVEDELVAKWHEDLAWIFNVLYPQNKKPFLFWWIYVDVDNRINIYCCNGFLSLAEADALFKAYINNDISKYGFIACYNTLWLSKYLIEI